MLAKITDDSIELNWRQPAEVGAAGIDGYIVEMQTIPGKWSIIKSPVEHWGFARWSALAKEKHINIFDKKY